MAGDFLQNIDGAKALAAIAPELIFYDPFSGNSDGRLWTLDAFERLRAACAGANTELFTYSASTAVRATMLAAGWYVATGRGIGVRAGTTIAINPAVVGEREAGQYELLGASWLGRRNRSGAKIPFWVHENEQTAFEAAVTGHWQFQESEAIG